MAAEEPKIDPTVSFRPDDGPRDEVIEDQKYGLVKGKVARKRGKAPALLPPFSKQAPPQTALAERLRQRLEKRRP
jgi:hypothetical protein